MCEKKDEAVKFKMLEVFNGAANFSSSFHGWIALDLRLTKIGL
jgi:hypothetical protein